MKRIIEKNNLETEKSQASLKFNEMINLCESKTCRRKIILNYFNEDFNKTNCKNCDICLEPISMKSSRPTKIQVNRDEQYQVKHQRRGNAERMRIQKAQTTEVIQEPKKASSPEEQKILDQMEIFKERQKQHDEKKLKK